MSHWTLRVDEWTVGLGSRWMLVWAPSTKTSWRGKSQGRWASGAEKIENILDPSQAGAPGGKKMVTRGCERVLLLRTCWKARWRQRTCVRVCIAVLVTVLTGLSFSVCTEAVTPPGGSLGGWYHYCSFTDVETKAISSEALPQVYFVKRVARPGFSVSFHL